MRYRLTIEQAGDDGEWTAPVFLTFDCPYTLDSDLAEWVRVEIDPNVEASAGPDAETPDILELPPRITTAVRLPNPDAWKL